MKEPRFDVVYACEERSMEPVVYIAPHFCREWDDEGGCYGTKESHGLAFDAAKQEVAKHHLAQAERWSNMALGDWNHAHGG